MSVKTIGVLDLQGDVSEHLDHLERLGIAFVRVKEPADFTGPAGLIIPGGESTCLSRLLTLFGIIRAPKIIHVGEGVNVLLKQDDYIAAAETPDVLVTVFHPELTPCLAFHRYFAIKCGLKPCDDNGSSIIDPTWNSKSWIKHAQVV